MSGKIFINYRRLDSETVAHRIYDKLCEKFGREAVFFDVDKIPLSTDFRAHLSHAVLASSVLLVIINQEWLRFIQRRVNDPNDWVRFEIETAFQGGVPVTPVLLGRTTMPNADELPTQLRQLAFNNAAIVSDASDFHHHMEKLAARLQRDFGLLPTVSEEPIQVWAALWDAVKVTSKAQDLRNFLAKKPPSAFVELARKKLEGLQWQSAREADDIHILQSFLKEFPNSQHANEARQSIAELKGKEILFQQLKRENEARARVAQERRRREAEAWTAVATTRSLSKLRIFISTWQNGEKAGLAKDRYRKIRNQKRLQGFACALLLIALLQLRYDTPIHTFFHGHKAGNYGLQLSPDGKLAISKSADDDRNVYLWNVVTGQKIGEFDDLKSSVLIFSADGNEIFGLAEQGIKIFDITTSSLSVRDIPISRTGEAYTRFSGDKKSIIAASCTNKQCEKCKFTKKSISDTKSETNLGAIECSSTASSFLEVTSDGRFALTRAWGATETAVDEMTKLWDITAGRELRSFPGERGQFLLDGKFVLTMRRLPQPDTTTNFNLWEAASGKLLQTFSDVHHLSRVAVAPDGKSIIFTYYDSTEFLDWPLRPLVKLLKKYFMPSAYFSLADIKSGKVLHHFLGNGWPPQGLAFLPDGKSVLTVDLYGKMQLWNLTPYLPKS